MEANPQSVLFCCDHNAVRSPMAEGIMKRYYGARIYVQSAGVRNDLDIDGFSIAVCAEIGVEIERHRTRSFRDMEQWGDRIDAYDLVVTSLVDEHLADLRPLYAEAARVAKPDGSYVIVGYHPHFIMSSGMPTHYDSAAGEPVAIETHVHLFSDHVRAAGAAGWTLVEAEERVIDDAWIELKPKWERQRGTPIAFAFVWR